MEFMFSYVPFQVTGDFYISTFGIFTQHLTYVSVLSLNRVTGVWLFLKQLCCFASLISWVPVLCFVHLLVCLPSSFIWGSSYCPIKMAESSGPLRQERTTTALISAWPKDLSSYFQDVWDLNLPAGGWHLVWGCTAENRWGSGGWSTGPWPQDEGLSNSVTLSYDVLVSFLSLW